jgi:multisubunit Na+/H+ antiporter MnhF subunit
VRATGAFSTPRPVPGRLAPLLAGATVIAVALPVFLLAGWPLSGWALGAVLWVGAQALGLLLARLRLGAGNLAASGVVGIGMTFRAVAVMIVIIAAAASDTSLAVAAALVYGLAYSLELALSLASYFGGSPTR